MTIRHGDAPRLLPCNEKAKNASKISDKAAMFSTFTGPGKFGFLFEGLDAFRPSDEGLIELAIAMEDQNFSGPDDPADDNRDVPAGFTYFGQFVDHDITFDKTQNFPEDALDPDEIVQGRTPSLDLDSLYGMGPELQPELYEQGVDQREARFAIGATSSVPSPDADNVLLPVSLPFDLPRQASSAAFIADNRNDENLLVAQTHLAFLKFHNKVLEEVLAGNVKASTPYAKSNKPETPFEQARRMVRWHYQWIILNELLPALIRPQAIQQVLKNGRKYFKFEDRGIFMPLEHSVAAYRLGHSMIRQTYDYNRVFRFGGLAPASLPLLFHFTGNITNQLPGLPTPGAPIPSNWIIDWRRFLKFPDSAVQPNATRKLDTKLANPLKDLPEFRNNPDNQPPALAQRNLLRGSRVGLPTGQAVAKFLKVEPLSADELASGSTSSAVTKHDFHKQSPLWFYILKEAEVKESGARLGEVGSTILAETFVGLMEGDKLSFLHADRNWKPTLGSQPGQFTLRHMVEWLDIVNPLGEGQS